MDASEKRIVGSGEKLSIKQALFYGFQSVLACNFFLGPIVIIGILQMDVQSAAALITYTFMACGLATLIQSGLFLKYQVIQGMSFAVIGAVVAIAMQTNFATVFGSLMIASAVLILIGLTKVFSKIVNRFIPGLIAGTVIIIIGLSLMPITFNSLLQIPGNPLINFLEAGVTFVAMVVFMRLGNSGSRVGRILSIGSVIYAIVIGTVVASFFGHVDLSPVASAPWLALPKLLPFGFPQFDLNATLILTFILLIVMVESIGTWFTISEMSGEKLEDSRIDRGVIGEGIGCLVGTIFGGLPVTSYASNSGVVAVTKVFSRYAAIGAGVIAVAMALVPKLMYLIAVVPSSVVWGIYGVICVAVLNSGLVSIRNYPQTERNNLILGISVLITIGTGLLPPALVQSMPPLLSYLFGSAICVGAITAIVLNLLLPEKEVDKVVIRSGQKVSI
jgi:NCS2 family nucleobase:cation symporter-2